MINFVICNASLELYKKKGNTLLNEYHHSNTNKDRNWEEIRPDVLHFCLMSLQDSILNKEKKVQVWIETLNRKLYKVSSDFRIPRTWKVFNKVFSKYLSSGSKTMVTEDDVVLVELLNDSLYTLIPNDAIKIAITQKGPIENLHEFIKVDYINKLWFFISASPIRYFEPNVKSNIIDVSDVYKMALQRNETPKDPNYSQDLEDELLNNDDDTHDKSLYTYTIATSQYNINPITICYSIVCTIESLLNL